jgi:uncharacterized protein
MIEMPVMEQIPDMTKESPRALTRSVVVRPFVALIRFYQHARAGRPSPCRFTPGCSTYALEALETHGLFRGTGLALRRITRCHPWGGEGYDPVPDRHDRDQKVN